jgi:C_GCAxxG_C_C family probable redox protein
MTQKSEVAVGKFQEGYNCAQSIFYSFCDDFQVEKNTALKIGCGFGAGMGLNGEVCGAVTGGIIVLGLKYSSGDKNDQAATYLTYTKTNEFMRQVTEKRGSYLCRKLLNGCDLTTGQGQKQFEETDLMNKVCKPCVESVAEILENVIK